MLVGANDGRRGPFYDQNCMKMRKRRRRERQSFRMCEKSGICLLLYQAHFFFIMLWIASYILHGMPHWTRTRTEFLDREMLGLVGTMPISYTCHCHSVTYFMYLWRKLSWQRPLLTLLRQCRSCSEWLDISYWRDQVQ